MNTLENEEVRPLGDDELDAATGGYRSANETAIMLSAKGTFRLSEDPEQGGEQDTRVIKFALLQKTETTMNATSNENSHPVNRALADEELDAVSGGTFLQPLFDRIHETQVSKAVDYVIGATITSLVKLVS